MNDIKIFESEKFGAIRTVEQNGEPWFAGKDVAIALGYSNPQKSIRDHVDGEDRTVNESFIVNGTPNHWRGELKKSSVLGWLAFVRLIHCRDI